VYDRIARFERSLKQETVRHFYFVDELPLHMPEHLLWQAPLLFVPSAHELLARAEFAARLWVRNLDLRLHDELVLVHPGTPFTLIAQRARRKGDTALLLGPIDQAVRLEGEQRVPNSELLYTERTTKRASA
jgi:hypothetical protein